MQLNKATRTGHHVAARTEALLRQVLPAVGAGEAGLVPELSVQRNVAPGPGDCVIEIIENRK